jgi:hypothetical protein
MTSIPPSVASDIAQTRQSLALNAVKQKADTDKQFANIIEKTAENAVKIAEGGRGQTVDIFA